MTGVMEIKVGATDTLLVDTAGRPASVHSTDSSLREKVIEHLFVGELLRSLWRKGVRDIEVLRPRSTAAAMTLP